MDAEKTLPSSAPLLKLAGVSSGYGAAVVLKDIDVEVRPGEIVALLGPNGAGKTTLLNTISRMTRIFSGSVLFRDEELARRRPDQVARLGISHCPEGRAIFQRLSVEDNMIAAHLPSRGRPAEELLEEAYGLFPILREKRHLNGSQLSGGQQQMLAIGRALMAEPELVMLDEPTLGLAPMVIGQIFEIILKLSERGKTIFFVEQNARLALELCDYAYIIENGSIRVQGTGEDLLGDDHVQRAFLGG